jgi:hypothetical protein
MGGLVSHDDNDALKINFWDGWMTNEGLSPLTASRICPKRKVDRVHSLPDFELTSEKLSMFCVGGNQIDVVYDRTKRNSGHSSHYP